MSKIQIKTIYVDVDGVLANTEEACNKLIPDWKNIRKNEVFIRMGKIKEFFRKPKPFEGAKDFIELLLETNIPIQILGACPKPTEELATSAKDKRWWIRKHIHSTIPIVLVESGISKGHLYGDWGNLLIDDTLKNIKLWEEMNGMVIHHASIDSTIARLKEYGVLK